MKRGVIMATLDREALRELRIEPIHSDDNYVLIAYQGETFVYKPNPEPKSGRSEDDKIKNRAIFIARSHQEVIEVLAGLFRWNDVIAKSKQYAMALGVLEIPVDLKDNEAWGFLAQRIFSQAEGMDPEYVGQTSISAYVKKAFSPYRDSVEPLQLYAPVLHKPGKIVVCERIPQGFERKDYSITDLLSI